VAYHRQKELIKSGAHVWEAREKMTGRKKFEWGISHGLSK
jgi:hypothetical protein